MQGALDSGFEGVFQYTLERRESCATPDQYGRAIQVLAHEKGPERSPDAQHGLFTHVVKHLVSKQATFHITNMQFDEFVIMRCIGNGKRTWFVIADQYVYILAGEKLHALGSRNLEVNADDVMGQMLEFFDTARQGLDLDITGCIDFTNLDGQITGWMRLTE